MKKLILIILLLNIYFAQAQRTIKTNELGFHVGGGNVIVSQMVNGTSLTKPSFFPNSDSLANMEYSQSGYIGNFPIGFNYTRWSVSNNHPRMDRGFSGTFGYGGRVVNSEEWSTIDTITYDTIIVQSSGAKFPVDSFVTDNYRMQTIASAMRFTIGYHYRFNWDRLDLVVGADVFFQQYAGKRREYRYTQRGTTNMPQSFHPDSVDYKPIFRESITSSEKIRMKSSSYGVQFPLEIRFHRRPDKEPKPGFWRTNQMGMIGIQVTPGIYYLKFNGIDKYYGSCSLGLNWVFAF